MYQLDRSSTNASNAATTSGVQYRSYASVTSATSCSMRARSQRSSGSRLAGFALGRDVRVVDEELRAVPERQQPALCLVGRAVAEAHVLARDLLAVEPAHDVRAHAVERLVGADGIAPRAVHLAPGLVEELLVREHAAVRRAPDERHRHEGDGVEPQPDLLAHLRHHVGGEPLLPVRVVRQVGRRQAFRGAGRVPAGDVARPRCPSRASRAERCRRRARRRPPPGCA